MLPLQRYYYSIEVMQQLHLQMYNNSIRRKERAAKRRERQQAVTLNMILDVARAAVLGHMKLFPCFTKPTSQRLSVTRHKHVSVTISAFAHNFCARGA